MLLVISFPTIYVRNYLKNCKMNIPIASTKKTKLAILALPLESVVDLFFFTATYISIIASKSSDKKILKIGKTNPNPNVKIKPATKGILFTFK